MMVNKKIVRQLANWSVFVDSVLKKKEANRFEPVRTGVFPSGGSNRFEPRARFGLEAPFRPLLAPVWPQQSDGGARGSARFG
jgi:hypothetical protein